MGLFIDDANEKLLSEWNKEKNTDIDINLVKSGSGKKVWWKCEKGHEWLASIDHRMNGRNCPVCCGKKILIGFNDLSSQRPEIAEEWDYKKNGDLKPTDVTCHSAKKVWWIGKCGHSWEARINHRTDKHSNCPYCSGLQVLAGFNDLQTQYPDLAKEWHPTKNDNLKPTDVTSGSGKKVWWLGKCGHEWDASIGNRSGKNKSGCPYCSNSRVLLGFNDLQSKYPDIAKEWHPTKNANLKPTDVTSGSGKKVWWLGKCGHEWSATVSDRINGKGCGVCANRIVLSGFNDLQTKYPDIAKEWHPTKNGDLKPTAIIFGSNKKVWWVCQFGHEWETRISERIHHNTGCPFCSGRRAIVGINDLQTKFPDIAKEWNYEKNGSLTPADVAVSSNKSVWWKCIKGHEWETDICNRTGKSKTGCPYCSNRKIIPGFNDLASFSPHLVKEWDFEKNKNLVDGNGYDISTPDKVSPVSGNSVWWKCDKGHEWKAKISNRTNGDGCPYCSNAGTSLPEQSVAFYLEQVCVVEQRIKIAGKEIDVYLPDFKIGIEYDGMFYHKLKHLHKEVEKDMCLSEQGIQIIRIKESNTNRLEDNYIYYSFDHYRANFIWALKHLCDLLVSFTGDERFYTIDIDVQRDMLKIRERYNLYAKKNSLSKMYPEIAKEWNYEKNGILTPDMFMSGANLKAWWKCSKGHEWQTNIYHRTSRGDGCPYCSGKRMLKGYNDFATYCIANGRKNILDEWDYDKNDKDPSSYSSRSPKKVWWKCSKGHEWFAVIGSRALGHGCPICNRRGKQQV
ncbi:MAG: hypothetical protein E7271_10630 [Lachnospiraceae bacterium]|jgi:translation initiation factor IF-1/glutaredoxin|nr:hypothetical protein [Lachnospiraceae bacterium]